METAAIIIPSRMITEMFVPREATLQEKLQAMRTGYEDRIRHLFFTKKQNPDEVHDKLCKTLGAKIRLMKEEKNADPVIPRFDLRFEQDLAMFEIALEEAEGKRSPDEARFADLKPRKYLAEAAERLMGNAIGLAVDDCDQETTQAGSWAAAAAHDMLEKMGSSIHDLMRKKDPLRRVTLPFSHFTSRVAQRRITMTTAKDKKWDHIERAREICDLIVGKRDEWMRKRSRLTMYLPLA